MKSKSKKSILHGIPSWGLALLTMLLAFIVLMVVGDIITGILNIQEESETAELVFYSLYNLIIAGGCFFICRQDPKSIWYVPVLCNVVGIIAAIFEPNFWKSSLWIMICGGWLLSVITSLAGAWMKKRIPFPANPEPDLIRKSCR